MLKTIAIRSTSNIVLKLCQEFDEKTASLINMLEGVKQKNDNGVTFFVVAFYNFTGPVDKSFYGYLYNVQENKVLMIEGLNLLNENINTFKGNSMVFERIKVVSFMNTQIEKGEYEFRIYSVDKDFKDIENITQKGKLESVVGFPIY